VKNPFPRLPLRRRLLIMLLAIATAITVALLLLYPPGGVQRKRPPPGADAPRCAAGQATACVGGVADVIVLPAPATSSSAAPARTPGELPQR
jgi:hypothetical protein